MKGRISKTLASILRNPAARTQLRSHLINGTSGRVLADGKSYRVEIEPAGMIQNGPQTGSVTKANSTIKRFGSGYFSKA